MNDVRCNDERRSETDRNPVSRGWDSHVGRNRVRSRDQLAVDPRRVPSPVRLVIIRGGHPRARSSPMIRPFLFIFD